MLLSILRFMSGLLLLQHGFGKWLHFPPGAYPPTMNLNSMPGYAGIIELVGGILLVLVTMLLAKRLFRSTLLAVIAGGLIAIDGNAIVMSRVALLDTMLELDAITKRAGFAESTL